MTHRRSSNIQDDKPAVDPAGQLVRCAAGRNTHGLSPRQGDRSSNQCNAVLLETPALDRVESTLCASRCPDAAQGRRESREGYKPESGHCVLRSQPPTETWSRPSDARTISMCFRYEENDQDRAGQLAGQGVLERRVLVPTTTPGAGPWGPEPAAPNRPVLAGVAQDGRRILTPWRRLDCYSPNGGLTSTIDAGSGKQGPRQRKRAGRRPTRSDETEGPASPDCLVARRARQHVLPQAGN